MFNVGTGELLLILVLALIVLGPDKLPSAARQAGKYLAEFRRISGGFQNEFRRAIDSALDEDGRDDYRPYELPELSDIGLSGSSSFTLPEPYASAGAVDTADAPAVNLDKAAPAAAPAPPTGTVEVDGPSSSFS